jgi:hypothetical protein
MSVVAPPPTPPPSSDDLEALIREARARQRRRLLFGTAGVAIVAAVGLSIWAAVPGERTTSRDRVLRSGPESAIAPCPPAHINVSLPRRFAGLGHLNGDLRFSNISEVACRLSGWPTVVAVQANGKTVRAARISALWMAWALNWPRSRPDRPVLLLPRMSAYVEIDGGDNPVGSERTCPAARWLRVTAPGGRRPVTISALWWKSAGRPVYYSLCGGIAVTRFFPASALPH